MMSSLNTLHREWRLFRVALGYFTRLPAGIRNVTKDELACCSRYLPTVALLIGVLCASAVLTMFHFKIVPPSIASLLFIVLLTWITGGIHEDALGDTIDALYAGYDTQKIREVMHDPRAGNMAVVAITLNYMLRWVAVHEILKLEFSTLTLFLILISSLTFSRCLILSFFVTHKAVEPEKKKIYKGRSLIQKQSLFAFMLNLPFFILPIGAGLTLTQIDLPLILIVLILLLSVMMIFYVKARNWIELRVKGLTGDLLGAIQQIGETLYLFTLALSLYAVEHHADILTSILSAGL